MPLICYACSCGYIEKKFTRQPKDALASIPCPKCGVSEMKRQLSGPSFGSKLVVDNGIQGRAVEIDLNVIESNLENSSKDFKNKT